MQGWIKLHRQIQENELYFSERFTRAQAWIDVLLLANHKPATVFLKGVEVNLTPGQLAWSQLSLAERWKWNYKTVKRFLTWLEKRGMVETRTDNITTIITIRNWSRYQTEGERNGGQNGEHKENEPATDKNVENDKKYNNENTSSSSAAPTPTHEEEEVIFTNEFFRVTKQTVEEWKKSYPRIKTFHPELIRVTDVLKEKIRRGEKIHSPTGFLHHHLKQVNAKTPSKRGNGYPQKRDPSEMSILDTRRDGKTVTLAQFLKTMEIPEEGGG